MHYSHLDHCNRYSLTHLESPQTWPIYLSLGLIKNSKILKPGTANGGIFWFFSELFWTNLKKVRKCQFPSSSRFFFLSRRASTLQDKPGDELKTPPNANWLIMFNITRVRRRCISKIYLQHSTCSHPSHKLFVMHPTSIPHSYQTSSQLSYSSTLTRRLRPVRRQWFCLWRAQRRWQSVTDGSSRWCQRPWEA